MRLYLVAFVLTFSTVAGDLSAQEWSLHMTPRLGYYMSDKPLGVGSPDGVPIRLAPSTMLGLTLDLSSGGWWGVRLSAEASFGARLEHALSFTETSCGSSCTSYEPEYERTGDNGSLLILGVQGVIDPAPQDWVARPYAMAGAGVTRYELPSTLYWGTPQGYGYGGRQASMAAQAGLGLRVDAGPGSITLEAIDNISGFIGDTYPTRSVSAQIFGPVRHDVTFGIGYRVRVF